MLCLTVHCGVSVPKCSVKLFTVVSVSKCCVKLFILVYLFLNVVSNCALVHLFLNAVSKLFTLVYLYLNIVFKMSIQAYVLKCLQSSVYFCPQCTTVSCIFINTLLQLMSLQDIRDENFVSASAIFGGSQNAHYHAMSSAQHACKCLKLQCEYKCFKERNYLSLGVNLAQMSLTCH